MRAWFREFQQHANVSRRRSGGRRSKTVSWNNHSPVWLARQNRFANCIVLKSFWREAVSRWTVNRRIRRGGLCLYPLSSETFFRLQPTGKQDTYGFKPCLGGLRGYSESVWSDESRFRLFKNDGRVRVWMQPGERYRDDQIQYSRQAGGGSVHVWGVIWSDGWSSL